jgi:hypothetical protein
MFVLTPADGLRCVWFTCPVLCWCLCPEIGTSSVDLAQLSRLLHEDGDRIQSPKRCLEIKTGRWMLSKYSIIALIYHRHKLLDLIKNDLVRFEIYEL